MDSIKRDKRNFFFAYNMIFDLPIDEHAKVVYLCLCRYADGENQSFPSQLTIGSRCGIKSRTTVKKAIDNLMETGLLDYTTRIDKTGGQSSNLYTIYNEPDEEVKKKYTRQHQDRKREPDKPHPVDLPPCPADGHPLFTRWTPPLSSKWTPPVHQMDTPLSSRWAPPVHQMDTKYTQLKIPILKIPNLSIRIDGQSRRTSLKISALKVSATPGSSIT